MDISRSEQVEIDLDRLIEKRHDQRVRDEGERAREQLWVESVRRFHERQEQDLASQWFEYERKMCNLHAALSEEHRERAERYRRNGNDKEAE